MTVRARSIVMWSALVVSLVALGFLAACSGSSDTAEGSERTDESTSCEASARQIIDRFDEFLEPHADRTAQDFLADPELDGLEEFQNDIAAMIVAVAGDPNDDCTEFDLEREVDRALQDYAGQGLLNRYLVGAVQQGLAVERRDIEVTPDDDLLSLLPLLGPGSTITFSEGLFELDATLLVQSDLLLVGAGLEQTEIRSSAESAAVAVLGEGRLIMNDLSVSHSGDLPASVVLVVDASIELVRVGLSGGIVAADGGGGSGLVLTQDAGAGEVTIDATVIADNGAAGVAVTGAFQPTVLNSTIRDNEQCGICFFDDAGGVIQTNTLTGNGVGLQSSNRSSPEISSNEVVDNLVAGVLIENDSTAMVLENRFEGEGTVGIDVQGDAAPVIHRNEFGPHAVAMSLRGATTATASENVVVGGDIGLLVGGTATPTATGTELREVVVSAMLHTEQSAGEFTGAVIADGTGAAIVVEGAASPVHSQIRAERGLVGAVFRQDAVGRLSDSVFLDQQVGFETSENAIAVIEGNRFVRPTDAGAIVGGGASTVRNNRFEDPATIGIQTGATTEATIEDNTVTGGDTGMLVTEASRPTVTGNTFTDQNFGIGVSGTAEPVLQGNEIIASRAGAVSFEDSAAGSARENRILDAGLVGIRVAGTATPLLEANVVFAVVPASGADDAEELAEGDDPDGSSDGAAEPGESVEEEPAGGDGTQGVEDPVDLPTSGAGLLYSDSAAGTAVDNELFGFVISIQVSDAASPMVTTNRADGAGVGGVGLLYGGNAGGVAEGNLSINQQLGFQIGGAAEPELVDNRVEAAEVAAFLIQGASSAVLQDNTCVDVAAGIAVLDDAAPELVDNDCAVLG